MNAELTRAAVRLDVSVNRRHCASSFLIIGPGPTGSGRVRGHDQVRAVGLRFNSLENIFVNGK